MKVCMYLRKSRQDEELEKRENTDTLARHRSTLLQIARKQNLDIIEVHEEIVSGGSIASRPKMLKLLDEVKNNLYDAVLCMDLDRLGRGGMQDQGLILDTFKESNTLIITPDKVYDLNNELDEEMTEFKAFFARRELKIITKRMQRGRIKSVEEGKFIASTAPFGYKFEYDKEGKKSLVIDEDKAQIVKNIFDMYLNGNGAYKIKTWLDSIGVKSNNDIPFSEQAVRRILKNEIYCGYVSWNNYKRRGTKSIKQSKDQIIYSKGKHEAIISEEVFKRAKEIMSSRQMTSTSSNKSLTNPFAGIVKCACCSHIMTCNNATYKDVGYVKFLRCKSCNQNRGVRLDIFEQTILDQLQDILESFEKEILSNEIENKDNSRIDNLKHTLQLLEKESQELNKQKNNLHDFLERGIYDVDTYLERTQILSKKTDENKNAINNILALIENEKHIDINYNDLMPNIKAVLDNYAKTDDIQLKNYLLKSIIEEIIYFKEKGKRNAKFEIDIKLKI